MITADSGVIICGCHGKIGQSLPVNEIACSLRQVGLDLRIVIGDDFCQSQELSRLIEESGFAAPVIGACSLLKSKVNSLEPSGHNSVVVDLLHEVEGPHSKAELVGRVKLLLCSQLHRQAGSKVIHQRVAKFEFPNAGGEVTRRQLFELPLPKYSLPMFVERSKCAAKEKCRICWENCSFDAIKFEQGGVVIDQAVCWGCGVCVAACPFNAIFYSTFSFEEIEREIEGLLLPNGLLEPRILAITCKTCISDSLGKFHYPANVLPLEIPCFAMVSPWFLLRAFDLGVQGLVLISSECKFELALKQLEGTLEFAQELLGKLGIEPRRVRILGDDELEQGLTAFAQEVGRLSSTPLRFSSPVECSGEGPWLPTLLKGMGEKLGVSLQGTVVGAVPFGKLELSSSKCTMCGLCTLECPTGALSLPSEEAGTCRLLFRQESCIGCGRCVNSCPEKCLKLQNVLELECLHKMPEVLFQDEIARCRECGAPIAFQSMLAGIKEKLSGSGRDAFYLSLCPKCRIRSQFKLVRK